MGPDVPTLTFLQALWAGVATLGEPGVGHLCKASRALQTLGGDTLPTRTPWA